MRSCRRSRTSTPSFISRPRPLSKPPWDDVLHNNIVGTYNVFEAARQAGVPRVVFASSTTPSGCTSWMARPLFTTLTMAGATTTRRRSGPIRCTASRRPTGRHWDGCTWSATACASSACGSAPCARTTTQRQPTPNPLIDLDAEGQRNRRRAVRLSRRDCAELIAACLDAEDVSWAVVYGVSGNPRRFWDLDYAREPVGWEPQDSAPVASGHLG